MVEWMRARRSAGFAERLDLAILAASAAAAVGAVTLAALQNGRCGRSSSPAAGSGADDPAAFAAPTFVARGKAADTPLAIPARGWREIAVRVFHEVIDDRVFAVGAGVAFYAILAIFPALVALVSLYGLVADLGTLNDHLAMLGGLLPRASLDLIREQVTRLVTSSDGKLGFAFVFGLLAAVWSANAGVKALFDALNVVYDEREKRSFLMLNVISLTFTAAALCFVLLAFNAVVVLPVALTYVGIGDEAEALLALGRWPVLLGSMLFGLCLVYRFGPSRRNPKWRWAAPGSVVAGLLWIAGSLAFSFYAENFASYDKTYGSLGAAIAFMTWIWMSAVLVLIGGELNAEMEHQTAIDTTAGRPRPLGLRGARMADEVAP